MIRTRRDASLSACGAHAAAVLLAVFLAVGWTAGAAAVMAALMVEQRWRVEVILAAGGRSDDQVIAGCWRVRAALVDELTQYGLRRDRSRRTAVIGKPWDGQWPIAVTADGPEQDVLDAVRRAVADAPLQVLDMKLTMMDDGGAQDG